MVRSEEAPPGREGEVEVHLGHFIEQIADYAIIALDPRGVIRSWNLGAQRVKGYAAEEAIGRSFSMFYPGPDRRAGLPRRLLREAVDKGRVEHTGWRVRKDGTRFWGDVVITAVHDLEGRHTGFVKVTRDRSDLKRLEDAQDAFYAAFSHDFKTPVSAMLGYIEALRHASDADRAHLIDRAEANAQHLFEMVEELVTIARQHAELASVLTSEVDLAAVARGALDSLPLSAGARRVRLSGDDVAWAVANEAAMRRVLTNLLFNALKYSPPSSDVQLAVRATPSGEVELAVADAGRGIDPDDLDAVFDVFERGRLATDDGGTGLGLASVRALVAQQDGRVHIDSAVGVGTTVTVTMPGASCGADGSALAAPQA